MVTPSEILRLSAMQNTDEMRLPSVPRGLGKEASGVSTTSLERQLAKVNQAREQFGAAGAGNGHGFGDCGALLGDLMGARNRANGGRVIDFENDAFPLLSKDNSAVDGALAQGVPNRLNVEGKELSVRSDKSKKSAFSLGFSRNV